MDHCYLRLFLASSLVLLMSAMTSGRALSISAEWKGADGKELLSDSISVKQRDQSLVRALTEDAEEAVRRGIALSDSSRVEVRSTADMSLTILNPGSIFLSPGDDVAIVVKRHAETENGAVQKKKPKPKYAPKKKPKAKYAPKKKPKEAKKSKGNKKKGKPSKRKPKEKKPGKLIVKENSNKEEEKLFGASIPKGNALRLDIKEEVKDSKKATNKSIEQLLNKTTSSESIHKKGYKSQTSKPSFMYQTLTSTTTGPRLSNSNLKFTMPKSQLNNSNVANKIFDYERLISKQNGELLPNNIFGGGKFGLKNNDLQNQKKTYVHGKLQHGQKKLFSKNLKYGEFGSEPSKVGLSKNYFSHSKQHEQQNNLFGSEPSRVGLSYNNFNHRRLRKLQNNLFSSKNNFDDGRNTRRPYKVSFSNDNFDNKLNRKNNHLYSPNENYVYGKFTTEPRKVHFANNNFNNGKAPSHTNLNNLYPSNNNFGNGKLTPEYNNLPATSTELDRVKFTPSDNNLLWNKKNKWQQSYNNLQYQKSLAQPTDQQLKYNEDIYNPVVYPKAQVKYDYNNGETDDAFAPWR